MDKINMRACFKCRNLPQVIIDYDKKMVHVECACKSSGPSIYYHEFNIKEKLDTAVELWNCAQEGLPASNKFDVFCDDCLSVLNFIHNNNVLESLNRPSLEEMAIIKETFYMLSNRFRDLEETASKIWADRLNKQCWNIENRNNSHD